jgi:hypothetical protein
MCAVDSGQGTVVRDQCSTVAELGWGIYRKIDEGKGGMSIGPYSANSENLAQGGLHK